MGIVKNSILVIVAGVGALTVIGTLNPQNTNGSDRQALIAKRIEFRENISKSPPLDIPILDCASEKISDQTVETLHLLFINKRGDLTNKIERENAVNDIMSSMSECGATPSQMLQNAKSDDENLMFKGLAISALLKDRGLKQ